MRILSFSMLLVASSYTNAFTQLEGRSEENYPIIQELIGIKNIIDAGCADPKISGNYLELLSVIEGRREVSKLQEGSLDNLSSPLFLSDDRGLDCVAASIEARIQYKRNFMRNISLSDYERLTVDNIIDQMFKDAYLSGKSFDTEEGLQYLKPYIDAAKNSEERFGRIISVSMSIHDRFWSDPSNRLKNLNVENFQYRLNAVRIFNAFIDRFLDVQQTKEFLSDQQLFENLKSYASTLKGYALLMALSRSTVFDMLEKHNAMMVDVVNGMKKDTHQHFIDYPSSDSLVLYYKTLLDQQYMGFSGKNLRDGSEMYNAIVASIEDQPVQSYLLLKLTVALSENNPDNFIELAEKYSSGSDYLPLVYNIESCIDQGVSLNAATDRLFKNHKQSYDAFKSKFCQLERNKKAINVLQIAKQYPKNKIASWTTAVESSCQIKYPTSWLLAYLYEAKKGFKVDYQIRLAMDAGLSVIEKSNYDIEHADSVTCIKTVSDFHRDLAEFYLNGFCKNGEDCSSIRESLQSP